MALFLRQNENRSELQQRVAAELQEKLRSTPHIEDTDKQKAAILENQHQTRGAGVLIAVLTLIAAGVALYVFTR